MNCEFIKSTIGSVFFILLLVFVFVIAFSCAPASAATWFVKPGPTNGDGTSWGTAFNNLQSAFNEINLVPGDEIWVTGPTTYKPDQGPGQTAGDRSASFTMRAGVNVMAGFNGTESLANQRDITVNLVTLSGDLGTQGNDTDNSYHIVTANTTMNDTARLDGFTITLANANGTGTNQNLGGGIYINAAAPAILRCTISANKAGDSGGGIYITGGQQLQPRIYNCQFDSNQSSNRGGGIANVGARPLIVNSLFRANTAQSGAGGGMWTDRSSLPKLVSCTFAKNTTTAAADGGVKHNNPGGIGGGITLANVILWANTANGATNEAAQITGAATLNYSCVQGWTGTLPGTGSFGSDPVFVNLAGNDYHLQCTSACRDTGNNTDVPLDHYDLDQNTWSDVTTPNEPAPDLDLANRNIRCLTDVGALEFRAACPGDATLNGQVNVDDLLTVINGWGTCPGTGACAGDVHFDDCVVNVDDLLQVQSNWGCTWAGCAGGEGMSAPGQSSGEGDGADDGLPDWVQACLDECGEDNDCLLSCLEDYISGGGNP